MHLAKNLRTFLLCLLLLIVGCNSPEKPAAEIEERKPPDPISVLLVEADDLGGEIARQWSARKNGILNVETLTTKELIADDYAALKGKDVLLYPSRLIGQLANDDQLVPLPDDIWNSPELESRGLFRDLRTVQAKFDGQIWGIPVSSPYFFQFVRDDVLKYLGKQIPSTWEEFDELVTLLLDRGPELSKAGLPSEILIPTKSPYYAQMLLAFSAANVRQRGKIEYVFDRSTMEPLIASEPFVLALNRLKRLTAPELSELTPEQVMRSYYDGKAAIAIGWPSRAFFRDDELNIESVLEQTSIARLPADIRWFDFAVNTWQDRESPLRIENKSFSGFQASMLAGANYPATVYQFLVWIGSKQTAATVLPQSRIGSPCRQSHLGDTARWTGDVLTVEASDQYIDMIRDINEQTVFLMFPRIPGSDRYLEAMNKYVRQCIEEQSDAETALNNLKQSWESITEEIGRPQQIECLRKDFGL